MRDLKKNITIKQWLALKPYNKQTTTDIYYIKLCNQVKQAIETNIRSLALHMFLSRDEIDTLTCFLTSYFEDVISGSNIWNNFTKIHKRLYNKPLPFYELEDYYEQEINLQDVCFLIWYFLNSIQKEKFIAPFNDFIDETAESVMDVLDDAWEYAPENEHLKKTYTIGEDKTDFYTIREVIDNVLFKTYLFYPDTMLDLLDSNYEIIERIFP